MVFGDPESGAVPFCSATGARGEREAAGSEATRELPPRTVHSRGVFQRTPRLLLYLWVAVFRRGLVPLLLIAAFTRKREITDTVRPTAASRHNMFNLQEDSGFSTVHALPPPFLKQVLPYFIAQ